jgi:glycosyltransferase involved in cell wall biosynthesis
MIGWELPPHNSGGLGVACEGLSQALVEDEARIDFTLPYQIPELVAINGVKIVSLGIGGEAARVGAPFSAYASGAGAAKIAQEVAKETSVTPSKKLANARLSSELLMPLSKMERDVEKYAKRVFSYAKKKKRQIDLVHAHDWMSLPAAMQIKQKLNKPMIAHIHSTEFDRSLSNDYNSYITRVEYEGMRLADKVIAVSYYTKRLLVEKYLIDPYKIEVVHNGINAAAAAKLPEEKFAPERPVVVFMGRLTMQKGPDYFLALAAKVLAQLPEALFIVAGDGDMYQQLLFTNAHYGLSANVLFSSFLRGGERDELMARADVFIMPSVSEPFGLVALEAVQAGTPVVISRNSGVAEVLYDTAAVDFWDIDALAEQTLSLLLNKKYKQEVLKRQQNKLKDVSWKKAAKQVEKIYQSLVESSDE